MFCISRSGRRMPEEKMAVADLAVPYDAPKVVRTMENVQPMAPKKDCGTALEGGHSMVVGLVANGVDGTVWARRVSDVGAG